MRTLAEIALVGTALAEVDLPSPFGALRSMPDASPERQLLLCAGASAAISSAGKTLAPLDVSAPSPPDARRACSARAASIVAGLFDGSSADLLALALGAIDRAGLRLPHALLPRAIATKNPAIRALLAPIVDARGRWLAERDDRGAWLLARETVSRASLEKTWTEGTTAERRDALGALRLVDPSAARAAVEQVWSVESADARASFVEALSIGLSLADEPLLERALRDRSVGVRAAAQANLARLPGSAFVARMKARADTILVYAKSALAFLGKRATLTITPLETADDVAERDGLGKPPAGTGAMAYWISRVLAAVPLAHWEERFAAKPDAIVASIAGSEWAEAIAEGWTTTATAEASVPWLHALFRFWQSVDAGHPATPLCTRMLLAIVEAIPASAADELVLPLFSNNARPGIAPALSALAAPWSDRIGAAYVRALRAAIAAEKYDAARFSTLARSAIALPDSILARALEPMAALESIPWARVLEPWNDTLRIRQILHEEIPL